LKYKQAKKCYIDNEFWFLWKHFHVFPLNLNVNILRNFLKKDYLKSNFSQLSHNMFGKIIACLAIARERYYA